MGNGSHRFPYLGRYELAAALVGALLGATTSILNHTPGEPWRTLAFVLDTAWAWASVGYLASLTGRSWRTSFVRCFTLFTGAVLVYFITDTAFGEYTTAPIADPDGPRTVMWFGVIGETVIYLVVAAITAAVLSWAAYRSRGPGLLGYLAALLLPVYTAWQSLGAYVRHRASGMLGRDADLDHRYAVAGCVGIIACGIALAVLLIRFLGGRPNSARRVNRTQSRRGMT
ncbi:hypothetical protein CGZ97_16560 [Enemella evansiae]|nr:hypothetical protein CGZ97_16560 [Enemella evansiae]